MRYGSVILNARDVPQEKLLNQSNEIATVHNTTTH